MKTVTHQDPGLPSFDLDDKATVIPSTDPELAIPVAASPRPIWLHGSRATLLGNVRGGAREVRMDGQRVVSELTVEAGPVANAVVSPGLLRRERISTTGSAEESVLVSPSLPMAALTYRGARPSRAALVAFPDAARIRYRTEGSAVTVTADDKDEVLVVAAMSSSAGWAARPAPEGGLRLEWSGEENAAGTDDGLRGLVLAFGSATVVRTALAGARHLAGHTVRAGSPLTGELLTLHSGAAGLDQAVHWMEHRLAAGVRLATSERPGPEPKAWLWTGLGACAVGDTESAKACIETLDRLRRSDEAMLLASRLALATGHQNELLDRVQKAQGLPASADSTSALRGLAIRTASNALRYAAPDQLLAELRRSADSGGSGASGRRLPTIGGAGSSAAPGPAEDDDLAEALTYLLERDSTARRRPWPSLSDERARAPLEAWTGLVAADREGWARWRTLVAAGLEGSDGGVGAWEPLEPGRPPAITGILLSALVHGWLGIHPDAPVGRLLLAPRVPARLTSFGVRGIRVGDASLDLEYVREGSNHCFELTPRSGRVPPMVVFEPVVYASEVTRILIDDKPAEVDVVATGEGGMSVPLQTPVDARRRVEIGTR